MHQFQINISIEKLNTLNPKTVINIIINFWTTLILDNSHITITLKEKSNSLQINRNGFFKYKIINF